MHSSKLAKSFTIEKTAVQQINITYRYTYYIPKGSRRPIIVNEDTQPEYIRAIGASHTACKDEFR